MRKFLRLTVMSALLLCMILSTLVSGAYAAKEKDENIYKNIKVKNFVDRKQKIEIEQGTKTISILGTADLHGYLYPLNYFNGRTMERGLARVSTYLKQLRASNPYVMAVDAGDSTEGTPFVYYYNVVDTQTVYPMMQAMGAMQFSSWTMGNHEFDYGLARLNRVINDAKKSNVRTITANLYNSDNSNFVEPYYIQQFYVNGRTVKIGIIGFTAKTAFAFGDLSEYSGLNFVYTVNDAKKWVPILKSQGADIIIGVMHASKSEAQALASSVQGIDAILYGHTHVPIDSEIVKGSDGKDVLLTAPRAYGESVSQIDITVDPSGTITQLKTMNVLTGSFEADQEIISLIEPSHNAVINYLETIIGKAAHKFSPAMATVQPNALIDLINKVQQKAADAQLSITSPQMSSSAIIPAGDIKRRHVLYAYPYDDDFLVGIRMTGLQLRKWMEHSVRYYKMVISPTSPIVKDPALNLSESNLDILYGAEYTIDLTKPAGSRITNFKYYGNLIKDTDVFTVAINSSRYYNSGNFMTAAGLKTADPAITYYNSSIVLGYDGLMDNILMNYVQENSVISTTISGNWRISTTPVE